MYRFSLSTTASLALLLVAASAHAADGGGAAASEYDEVMALTPDLDGGRQVYLVCAVCHQPEGWGSMDGAYPQIAGQLPEVIVRQLVDIRAGKRANPLMYPFAGPRILGGPQRIADVAAYIAQLPMAPHSGVGPGIDLARGEALYAERCAACHGPAGEGNSEQVVSALAGQHFAYLMRQLDAIRSGQRPGAHEQAQEQVMALMPQDEVAIADYLARRRPAARKVAEEGWMNPDFPEPVRQPMALPPAAPGPGLPADVAAPPPAPVAPPELPPALPRGPSTLASPPERSPDEQAPSGQLGATPRLGADQQQESSPQPEPDVEPRQAPPVSESSAPRQEPLPQAESPPERVVQPEPAPPQEQSVAPGQD